MELKTQAAMASSVASAAEMERWKRARELERAKAVPVSQQQQQNFKSMRPDFAELASFESKVQRLAERQEAKEQELEVDQFFNVMGSTAGAGSGCVAGGATRPSYA